MNAYLTNLSVKQKIIGFVGFIVTIVLLAGAAIQGKTQPSIDENAITISMSIKMIAPKLKVTGKALAKELKLPLDVPKGKPLSVLKISKAQLDEVVHHLSGHTVSNAKYLVYIALVVWAWLVLVVIGRPRNSTIKERECWYPDLLYIAPLILSVVMAGFYFGKSPNPMEGIVKVFKTMVGLYPDPWVKIGVLALFAILAIVGNKLICGWACPFGALQELIYKIPLFKKLKQKQLPFYITNTFRSILFLIVLIVLFGWVGSKKGMVIYHLVNPFNIFNWDFETTSIMVTIIVSLMIGLVMYRPFCKLICPFGWFSWLLEKISLYKVRINHEKCIKCMACVKACPTSTTNGLINKKVWLADCFSCKRCLSACPVDAIRYGLVKKGSRLEIKYDLNV